MEELGELRLNEVTGCMQSGCVGKVEAQKSLSSLGAAGLESGKLWSHTKGHKKNAGHRAGVLVFENRNESYEPLTLRAVGSVGGVLPVCWGAPPGPLGWGAGGLLTAFMAIACTWGALAALWT
jgi:hypothetical protein